MYERHPMWIGGYQITFLCRGDCEAKQKRLIYLHSAKPCLRSIDNITIGYR